MSRPVPKFDVRNSCPKCHEPLRLVLMRTTAALPGKRHLLVCSSPSCTYSASVDSKAISDGLRRALND
ncbi:MAG TPA: hypothetical protein VMS78_05075 [Rhizomicrobium sp.]|nr:hypothetical protein [Rhizomicrobium sp.]